MNGAFNEYYNSIKSLRPFRSFQKLSLTRKIPLLDDFAPAVVVAGARDRPGGNQERKVSRKAIKRDIHKICPVG